MKFAAYLKRDPQVDRDGLPETAPTRLERELEAGADLARLVKLGPEVVGGLGATSLVGVIESHRRWKKWRERAVTVSKRLESIEREVVSRTTRTHQLAAIERGLRLCEASCVEANSRPSVLATVLELWDASRAEVRRRGRLRSAAAKDDHPALAQYDDHVGRTFELEELRSYSWMAVRRGEREGALRLELDLAGVPLLEQLKLRRGRLGKAGLDRTDESLLQELVLDDLVPAVLAELDEWARTEALKSAANAYMGLLASRPLRVERLAAVFLGSPRKPIGAVVVDSTGAVLDSLEVDSAEPGWLDRLGAFVTQGELQNLVVPSDSSSSKRLADLQAQLGATAVVPVRPAAMTEGRELLEGTDRELPRAAQDALVLARRALFPLQAWGGIDPVRVGLGEYQAEIDESEIREVLVAAREQAKRTAARAPALAATFAPSPGAQLATTVRTVSELRPGMMLAGSITNLTGFGAFVSLGLEYEGMIHVSELSDEYVSDPAEVLQVGQKVTARVLEVEPQRRRISLSLRSANDRRERRNGGGSGRGAGGGRSGGGRRSQVLRDLDNLFKKP